jgi:hypothetical protein
VLAIDTENGAAILDRDTYIDALKSWLVQRVDWMDAELQL